MQPPFQIIPLTEIQAGPAFQFKGKCQGSGMLAYAADQENQSPAKRDQSPISEMVEIAGKIFDARVEGSGSRVECFAQITKPSTLDPPPFLVPARPGYVDQV